MAYVNMYGMLHAAQRNHYAVPAFNIVNELSARAVVNTAISLKAPVILQTSVSTVKHIGPAALIGFLKEIAHRAPTPVAVHLDHCTDTALAKHCIDLGWSSVMIDASMQPIEENIRITRSIVEYAHPLDVTVEGELGAIAGVEDNVVVSNQDAYLASVEGSVLFVEQTGVDAFAPAVGTAHGQYKSEPKLDFQRFQDIRKKVETPLVVHGGTGLSDEVFRKFIALGAAKINISTALKIAYCSGMRSFVIDNPENTNPLSLDANAEQTIAAMCREMFELFSACNQA